MEGKRHLMTNYRILITDGLEEAGKTLLLTESQVDDCTGIAADELLKILNEYDGLIVRSRTKVTAQVMEAAPRLRVIGRAGVGVDTIDLPAAKARSITVVNSPTATTTAVAELTLALMLDLARRTPFADASMKRGEWQKKALKGSELSGKTLGIIGVGNIGSAVAHRASGFGMRVIGFDELLSAETVRANGAEPVSLDGLYAAADYISIHVPLTEQTRGMVDAASFTKMKPGVRIVCTARGGVIEEDALLAALGSGRVAGAGLDVFAEEPPGISALVAHPNVVATPHIGAQTAEAQERAAVDIASEVLNALNGRPLRWKVV